jgi:hypothetical protein
VIGLDHVSSSDADLLMEPALNLRIDGPQLDDIRGLQRLYGDGLEQSYNGAGDGVAQQAYALGRVEAGQTVALGSSGTSSTVAPDAIDFLGISGLADLDYFSFQVNSPGYVDIRVTPLGGNFREGRVGEAEVLIQASASNDLSFRLFSAQHDPLAVAAATGRGEIESLHDFVVGEAGTYLIEVGGIRDAVQLYELSVHVHSQTAPEPAGSKFACLALIALTQASRARNLEPYC